MNPSEPDPTVEPSNLFVPLVPKVDAALHDHPTSELSKESIEELSPEELTQFEGTRRQLELLYKASASPTTAWQSPDSSNFRRDIVSDAGGDDFDFSIDLNAQSLLGIHDAHFGRFEVLRSLGMGGEGVVFLARDPVLDRLVALKVPRPDVLLHSSRRKRFLTEGRAAALLTHPNIVTVFESGEVGTVCYLAQDYITGPSLSAWLRDHPQPVSPLVAVRLMLQLAEAVALAHSRQILHRDIKPGNILLAPLTSAAPLDDISDFVPKLSDFGMAKLVQDQGQTQTGTLLGTPAYMSPEQAAGSKELIAEASDIYGLGAVLYELLTHHPLYRGKSALETIHQVLQHDPPNPCTIVPGIPRDLEAICLKCLRREPQDRYRTSQELADDLRRFLENRPVVARPRSVSTTVYRWSRRNPVVVALLLTVILAVISLLVGSLWFSAQLKESLQIAQKHQQELQVRTLALRQRVYAADLHQASEAWQDGKATEARQRLEACIPLPGEADLRSFPWWMLSHQIQKRSHVIGTFEKGAMSASVAINPEGDVVACGEPDGVIRLRSLPAGQLIGELRGHARGTINALHFSPIADEQLLVSAGDDGTVRVWDLKPQKELHALLGHQGRVFDVKFIGKHAEAIASGGADRVVRIWDRHSGRLLSELSGHSDTVRSLQEQSDTGVLFSAAQDSTIRLWDWRSAQPDFHLPEGQLLLPQYFSWARSLALSPDGTELVTGFRSGHLVRWNVAAKDSRFGSILRDQEFASGIRTVTWRDNQTLVVGFADSRMLLKRKAILDGGDDEFLAGHSDWILGIDVVPGGKGLVSISKDGAIRLWPGEEIDGTIRIASQHDHLQSTPSWHDSILTVVMSGEVFGYAMPEGTQIFRLTIDDIPPDAWTCRTVDGARLLTTERSTLGTYLTSFEIATGERVWQLPLVSHYPSNGSLSPDGKRAFLCVNNELWSVDVEKGERLWLTNHPRAVTDIQFVPRGDFVVTVCADGVIRIWNSSTGQLLQERPAHQNSAQKLAVSQDGQLLATAGEDLRARVWQMSDGKEIASFGLTSELAALYFADEGRTLIAHDNNQLRFWSVPNKAEVLRWHLLSKWSRTTMSQDTKTIAVQDGRSIRLFRGDRFATGGQASHSQTRPAQ